MTQATKDRIESGVKNLLFPIVMTALGSVLAIMTSRIAASLDTIEKDILNIKLEGRDTIKDIQFINIRLNNIERDLIDIKKNIAE